jgi:uncharacterized protein YkwD
MFILVIGVTGWVGWKYKDEIREAINPPYISENIEEKTDTEIKTNTIRVTTINKKNQLPTVVPKKTVTPTVIVKKKVTVATPTPDNGPWGVAKQIDEVTWTMKVGEDGKMATAKEIWDALNQYRKNHGSQVLNWDEKLANYANERAKYLYSIKAVDKHTGFINFVNHEDGFNKLGFTALGENISYGYKLNGVHIIEWMYAGDEPHDKNQLDNRWNYVGIGVNGLATCLIFGTGKF